MPQHDPVLRYFAALHYDHTYRKATTEKKQAALKDTKEDKAKDKQGSGTYTFTFENDLQYQDMAKKIDALGLPVQEFKTLIADQLTRALNTRPAQIYQAPPTQDAKDAMGAKLAQQPMQTVSAVNNQLIEAVKANEPAVIAELIQKKSADPNTRDSTGKPLCMLAAELGYVEVLNALINAHVDLEAKDADNQTALIVLLKKSYTYRGLAMGNRYLQAIKALLTAGVSPNTSCSYSSEPSQTLLQIADRDEHTQLADLLLECGADPAPLLSTTYPSASIVVAHTAATFLRATQSHCGYDEWENLAIVRQLSQNDTLSLQHGGLRVRANLPDGDSRIEYYPMHTAKADAIDLISDLKMPDGRSCYDFIQNMFKAIDITSPIPSRVSATASTVALPGEFLKDDNTDLTSKEFILDCCNENPEEEKNAYLSIVWPTNAAKMSEVRVDWFNLSSGRGLGCIGGHNDLFLKKEDLTEDSKKDQKEEKKEASKKSQTRCLNAREIPNEILNEKLTKAANENGAHAVFIALQRRRSAQLYTPPRERHDHFSPMGNRSGTAAVGAGLPPRLPPQGIAMSVGALPAQPAAHQMCALLHRSSAPSAYATVSTGSDAKDNRSNSRLDYSPVLRHMVYHRTGALVANIGRQTAEQKKQYDREATVKRYKALMVARTWMNEKSLPHRLRYTAQQASKELEKQNYRNATLLGAEAKYIKECKQSSLYPDMLCIRLDKTHSETKRITDDINRRAKRQIACHGAYDSSDYATHEEAIYLDATALVEFTTALRTKFNNMTEKHSKILNETLGAKANIARNFTLALTALTLLRAHGISDTPSFANVDIGEGDLCHTVTMHLGIPRTSAETLVKAMNASFPGAATLHPTGDPNIQKIAIVPEYLDSDRYLNLFRETFTRIFTQARLDERDIIDHCLISSHIIDCTLRECSESLRRAVGLLEASSSFATCMESLARELSRPTALELKTISPLIERTRQEVQLYTQQKSSSALFSAVANQKSEKAVTASSPRVNITEVERALNGVERRLAMLSKSTP